MNIKDLHLGDKVSLSDRGIGLINSLFTYGVEGREREEVTILDVLRLRDGNVRPCEVKADGTVMNGYLCQDGPLELVDCPHSKATNAERRSFMAAILDHSYTSFISITRQAGDVYGSGLGSKLKAEIDQFFFSEKQPTFTSLTKKTMSNLVRKFRQALKSEPFRSFQKTGVVDSDDNLTSEGKDLFLNFLLEKHKDDFKTSVVDALAKELENKKDRDGEEESW